MILSEIVNRPDDQPINQPEAMFVIREYVKIRKGIDIDTRIETGYGNFIVESEVRLMVQMVNVAVVWFKQKCSK